MFKVTIRACETMAQGYNADYQTVLDHIAGEVIRLTGGVTVDAPSMGYWKDAAGNIVSESGNNIWTLCEGECVLKLRAVAQRLKECGRQDTVLFTVEEVKAVDFL